MDDLPLLVYRELFERHIGFKEKQTLRLVCKKWKWLIELFQEELVVYKQIWPYGVKWPDTGQPMDFKRDAVETHLVIYEHERHLNKNFEKDRLPKAPEEALPLPFEVHCKSVSPGNRPTRGIELPLPRAMFLTF